MSAADHPESLTQDTAILSPLLLQVQSSTFEHHRHTRGQGHARASRKPLERPLCGRRSLGQTNEYLQERPHLRLLSAKVLRQLHVRRLLHDSNGQLFQVRLFQVRLPPCTYRPWSRGWRAGEEAVGDDQTDLRLGRRPRFLRGGRCKLVAATAQAPLVGSHREPRGCRCPVRGVQEDALVVGCVSTTGQLRLPLLPEAIQFDQATQVPLPTAQRHATQLSISFGARSMGTIDLPRGIVMSDTANWSHRRISVSKSRGGTAPYRDLRRACIPDIAGNTAKCSPPPPCQDL
jgi:hypothetical protein